MKTKLSLFLDPDIAKAIKIQAARHGVKVSKLIEGVFTCQTCYKPITDAPMTLLDNNGFQAFAHKKKC
jgi:Family of unknown function (DUF6364)